MKLMLFKHRFGDAVCHLALLHTSEPELLTLVHRVMIRLSEFSVGRSTDSCSSCNTSSAPERDTPSSLSRWCSCATFWPQDHNVIHKAATSESSVPEYPTPEIPLNLFYLILWLRWERVFCVVVFFK